jgi:hypothetical protein
MEQTAYPIVAQIDTDRPILDDRRVVASPRYIDAF